MKRKIPEILAPAGNYDCAKAAVLAGADALYLGIKKFNARERAENMELPELKAMISIAHSRGVKVYVTMNVLLTQDEMEEAAGSAADIFKAGADALIVQDAGLLFLIHKYLPDFELHASTQMTAHNSLQVDFLKALGVKSINFARELSYDELKKIIAYAKSAEIKSEIFVHGAYCISCSGICYMSSFIAAQAGNRGRCLQPCRKKYGLSVGAEKKYLLSLKDNNSLENCGKIAGTGADILKIEGRIKNFNYVYTVTHAWRKKLKSLFSGKEICGSAPEEDVKKVFNRGFSTGYFDGRISPDMFVRSPLDCSMIKAGTVVSFNANRQELLISPERELLPGERISIYTEDNFFICSALIRTKSEAGRFLITLEDRLRGKILKGQIVLLLPDPKKMEAVKKEIDLLIPEKVFFDVELFASEGSPLKAVFRSGDRAAEVSSSVPLAKAEKRGLSEESIKAHFGKTGDLLCSLGRLRCRGLESGLFLPVKELNSMRREGLERLFSVTVSEEIPKAEYDAKRTKSLAVLISSAEEGELFADMGYDVFAEWFPGDQDIFSGRKKIYPWFPAFIPDDSVPEYIKLMETAPRYIVSDNAGIGFKAFQMGIKWIAGPMLNSANSFALRAYAESGGASGGFLSPELSREQLTEITAPERFTLFMKVFGPLTLMTVRQCLLASAGKCRSGRDMFESTCVKRCRGYEKFYDEKDIPFHVVKSSGYINRLFNDALLFLPEACCDINADFFLVDLRTFPFLSYSRSDKLDIFDFFLSVVKTGKIDRERCAEIKKLSGNVTRGNYRRGF